jgi:flagellar biosynthesis protein FlhB
MGWASSLHRISPLAAVTVFEMKRLFITEAEQQPLVNGLIYAMDVGLGLLFVLLAGMMVWRLIDLFKPKGRWAEEHSQELSQEVKQ